MKRFLIIIALLQLALPAGLSQSRPCLRIMPIEELTRNAAFIARVKVVRAEDVNKRGPFGQIALLQPVDVIDGDFTLKQLNVAARSNVRCAEDEYRQGQDMLVFLITDGGLFRTLNFQYGRFEISGELVRGWRDKTNKVVDKPYAEVRKEIENILNPATSRGVLSE